MAHVQFRASFGGSTLAIRGNQGIAVIEKRVGCYDIEPTPAGNALGVKKARVATYEQAREHVISALSKVAA